jgi:FSR family fosmidomycin resistance protein-like MFS transporter
VRLLRHPLFLAVSLSHLSVDTLNGQVGVLLAALSVSLALNNATIGLIATLYTVIGSLTQPLFGWMSDRYGGRWLVAGGVLWMAICFSLFAILPAQLSILFLVMGALGSAAFHPHGTSGAAQVGYTHLAGHAATAASLFFLFGQSGLSFGPAIGGIILDHLGRAGILIITVLIIPVGLFAANELRSSTPPAARRTEHGDADSSHHLSIFLVALLVSGVRSWAANSTTIFAPKYFHDLNMSATVYGAIIAFFMGGSAIGGVVGGVLGDRWGRRRTITLTLLLSAIPFFYFPYTSGVWLFVFAAIAGALNGASHSILVTVAQRAMPNRAAFASGLILGFMFTAGALGSYFSGLIADQVGLDRVLQGNAFISLAAAIFSSALLLDRRAARVSVVASAD